LLWFSFVILGYVFSAMVILERIGFVSSTLEFKGFTSCWRKILAFLQRLCTDYSAAQVVQHLSSLEGDSQNSHLQSCPGDYPCCAILCRCYF
jgi:hypothetical protein